MYDARAIANFFLDRAAANSQPVSAMTLLKVLYFAHAWHLAKFDAPLVAQPFEAWKNGPVVRVVYDQVKLMRGRSIDFRLRSFDPVLNGFKETSYAFDTLICVFLENIFDFYGTFHPFQLSDLTHEKGSPWDAIWSKAESAAIPGMVIPNEKIRTWFLQSGPEHLRSAQQRYAI